MVSIDIRAVDNKRVRRLGEALDLDATDRKSILVQLDKQFRKHTSATFRTLGKSSGRTWPPLKPATIKQKRALRKSRRAMIGPVRVTSLKAMQRTQELKKGVTTKRHPDHIARVSLRGWQLGTKNIVAEYHRNDRAKGVPKRDVLRLSRKQQRLYSEIVFGWQVKKLRRIARTVARARGRRRRVS